MKSADELNAEGARRYNLGDLDAARSYCLAALQVDPDYWMAHANLSVFEGQNERLHSALAYSAKVLQTLPHDGTKWNNRGNLLMRVGRYNEARTALERAAELTPDDPGMWHNRAILGYRVGEFSSALMFADKALQFSPDDVSVHETKAHILLALGDLERGLEEYEFRWFGQLIHLRPWDFYIPEWQGQDLQGKRILLHSEQGFGDAIMCLRFAQDFLTRGAAHVVIGVDPALVELVRAQGWENVSTLDISRMDDSSVEGIDFQTPMFGALRHLGFSPKDISGNPYLSVPTQNLGPGFNVGLCWASGKRGTQVDWRRRQVPLELLLPLAEIPTVRLHCLQVGDGLDEIETLGAEGLIRCHHLGDFLQTARIIMGLDLVITVDSAVAHLSAALGKPTWMLSPKIRCWRWWDDKTGRPWYNRIKQFRQETSDWVAPASAICAQLSWALKVERRAA